MGGEGSGGGESSFHFPVTGDGWNAFHSSGVDSLLDNVLKSGCLGNKGVVRLGVIETIRGRGDTIGVASFCGGDGVSDWGNGISMGSSMTMGSGSYCSIDEYSRRCDPQGTKGSGGVSIHGGSTGGRLGGVGMNGGANGDGSTRGGDGILGTMGGNGMSSLGRDDDGWMYSCMTGGGPISGGGATTDADGGDSGIGVVGPPAPEGPGLGMKTGDGDLLLMVLLRLLRSVRSPSRNVWSFKTW